MATPNPIAYEQQLSAEQWSAVRQTVHKLHELDIPVDLLEIKRAVSLEHQPESAPAVTASKVFADIVNKTYSD